MADPDREEGRRSLRSRSVERILGGASSLLARSRLRAGEEGTSVRDELLLRAQKATFEEMHRRYTDRAGKGEGGLVPAMEAFDQMWWNIRQLRAGAGTIVQTLSSPQGGLAAHVARFYEESTALLEDAIRVVFAEDMGSLAVPPDRMAVLVRVVLEGLVVELAHAKSAEDVAVVDQIYADVRVLFERFVLAGGEGSALDPLSMDPIPLPW